MIDLVLVIAVVWTMALASRAACVGLPRRAGHRRTADAAARADRVHRSPRRRRRVGDRPALRAPCTPSSSLRWPCGLAAPHGPAVPGAARRPSGVDPAAGSCRSTILAASARPSRRRPRSRSRGAPASRKPSGWTGERPRQPSRTSGARPLRRLRDRRRARHERPDVRLSSCSSRIRAAREERPQPSSSGTPRTALSRSRRPGAHLRPRRPAPRRGTSGPSRSGPTGRPSAHPAAGGRRAPRRRSSARHPLPVISTPRHGSVSRFEAVAIARRCPRRPPG